ncbi:MAG TPA: triose-phosphate isomerase family protein [Candidatus Sulfotelmatobacter sp.]|nr:triose-phosphate isomerase family protein [Candidatus Sulfotelmatobacter sp.]
MKKVFIVANIKSYETENEAKKWLDVFKNVKNLNDDLSQKEIIICPPFTLLELFKEYLQKNGIRVFLGAQDLSQFDQGAYTGEINARQIRDFAKYVLIGHSERRKNFNETKNVLLNKVKLALAYGIKPIYIIQNDTEEIPEGVEIIAYEPVFAIGSGKPDNPENAEKVASSVKSKNNGYNILYGGSVNSTNVQSFTKKSYINGVLVGGASLDPEEFINIIKNA